MSIKNVWAAIVAATILGGAICAPATATPYDDINYFRGQWNSYTYYNSGNVSTYNGTTYVALTGQSNQIPSTQTWAWASLGGATGAQGPAGAAGAAGVKGATGAQGVAGTNGTPGLPGAAGAMGPPGLNGAVGAAGLKGATGANGAPGAQGVPGTAGAPGANGTQGATGANGASGAGLTYVGTWNAAGIYNVNDVVTERGTSYVQILSGLESGIDPFFDVNGGDGNCQRYPSGQCSGGTWAIVAAAGAPGAAGATGAVGAMGDPGLNGAVGAAGVQGPMGVPGPVGPMGPPGLNGSVGATGVPGAPGFPGAMGAPGAPGAVGAAGAVGPTGPSGSSHQLVIQDAIGTVIGPWSNGVLTFFANGVWLSTPFTDTSGPVDHVAPRPVDVYSLFGGAVFTTTDCSSTPLVRINGDGAQSGKPQLYSVMLRVGYVGYYAPVYGGQTIVMAIWATDQSGNTVCVPTDYAAYATFAGPLQQFPLAPGSGPIGVLPYSISSD